MFTMQGFEDRLLNSLGQMPPGLLLYRNYGLECGLLVEHLSSMCELWVPSSALERKWRRKKRRRRGKRGKRRRSRKRRRKRKKIEEKKWWRHCDQEKKYLKDIEPLGSHHLRIPGYFETPLGLFLALSLVLQQSHGGLTVTFPFSR
jgi:hypothetical protein